MRTIGLIENEKKSDEKKSETKAPDVKKTAGRPKKSN